MDKKNDKRNVVNNNHMENCNVFMGRDTGHHQPTLRQGHTAVGGQTAAG